MISIIVPVYNTEKYISECVDSILAQTYTDFELLLIDDGSTDGSRDICDAYAKRDSRIRVFHKKNGGAGSARNIGLANAKGEWITFVDSDDFVDTNYLSTFSVMASHADITYFPFKQFFENGDTDIRITKATKVEGRECVEQELANLKYGKLGDLFGWTWNKVFKAEIINKHCLRFPEDVKYKEDEVFTMYYNRYITSLEILDVPLYYYRVVPGSITSKGINDSDYIPLSNHLMNNLPFYKNETLQTGDKRRIINYRIQHVLKNVTFLSVVKHYRPLHKFIHAHSDIASYSSYHNLIRVLGLPYWVACVVLILMYLLRSIWKKTSL